MIKIQLQIAIVFLVCLGHFRVAAQSTTVGYGSELGQPNIWTSSGQVLADGNQVAIGYFDDGFDPVALGGDLDQLLDAWNPYATTTTYTDAGEGGHFYGQDSSADPVFVNKQIWLFVFKTSDDSEPNPGNLVTEYGLFSSSASNWRFPPLVAPPGNRTDIDTSQLVDPSLWAWGSVSGGHLHLAQFAPVPEPAVGGLVALGFGLFGLLAKRRKS